MSLKVCIDVGTSVTSSLCQPNVSYPYTFPNYHKALRYANTTLYLHTRQYSE